MVRIQQLAIYPVKSLRGFTVESAQLTAKGLLYDRHWMVIDENNRFVSQRKFGNMVLIHTQINNGQLILSIPSNAKSQPLFIDVSKTPSSTPFEATIWKDICEVIDEGEAASQWLTHALSSPTKLRLVRMGNKPRPQSKPGLVGVQTHTDFADAAPFLVANTQSLAAVNQQLAKADLQAVTIERFRPNIVLEGIDAFAEHQVQQLIHPNYQLKHCYPCERCVMPTIDIATGIRHPQQQPFSLIADINPMPGNAKSPAFGENAVLVRGEGSIISVGDMLSV